MYTIPIFHVRYGIHFDLFWGFVDVYQWHGESEIEPKKICDRIYRQVRRNGKCFHIVELKKELHRTVMSHKRTFIDSFIK